MSISMQEVMKQSGVAFGTSGARGLVTAMTDRVCYVYARSFIKYCEASYKCDHTIAIAGDLRPSTERILKALVKAGEDSSWKVIYCGRIPSPAIALYGIDKALPTIMVTGSHIPADRNGIKFNHPQGEITKKDEQGIVSQSVDFDEAIFDANGMLKNAPALPAVETEAEENYCKRYPEFFGAKALQGLTIGVYQHSAVGRDIVVKVLESLGATVKPFARSETFIPVDTEAIRKEDEDLARDFAHKDFVDAIFSTDGDSDRPLLADDVGMWLRGDVLGILAAQALGIKRIATPVSCNTSLEKSGSFEKICRTRIGSPYVIAGMESLVDANDKSVSVAGYEANGGFLLQTNLTREFIDSDGRGGETRTTRTLPALPTRDALLPMIAVMVMVREQKMCVVDLLKKLPKRFTLSDRLKEFSTETSKAKLAEIREKKLGAKLFGALTAKPSKFKPKDGPAPKPFHGEVVSIDETDGYRMEFDSGDIVHLRPSGNAPEFRCYVETEAKDRSAELLAGCMKIMEGWRK
ncbi:phosphomannomutase [Fibrobacter succinogenes]|uniref:phosphomannomutase n=1 Tax=Fibrobacter succinogenes TaxID=833 RepID=UPI0013D3BB26|nr:phosphomannomutase [Fibrobacter succinogenes]